MNLSYTRKLAMMFCLLTVSVFAEEVRDSATGESFPKEITVKSNGKDYQLKATGVATRKKFFVKVYSVASYIQEGTADSADKFAQFLQDDRAKQLSMKFVHNASAEKLQEGYEESFKNSIPEPEFTQLQPEIKKFVGLFDSELVKGDELILRWLPGGLVEVFIKGKQVGTFQNKEFAKGLWNIWFGQKSVVDRNNLVSLLK